MIKLTFTHDRDIFKGNEYKKRLKELFPSIRFEGFLYGYWYPTVSIPLSEWIKSESEFGKTHFARKVTKCEGEFNLIEYLAYGVRPFVNIFEGHPDFHKVSEHAH